MTSEPHGSCVLTKTNSPQQRPRRTNDDQHKRNLRIRPGRRHEDHQNHKTRRGWWNLGLRHNRWTQIRRLGLPEHAECEEYELAKSRISKLWLQRLEDKKVVFNWDRGLDLNAQTNLARAIVDFLAAGLADLTYAN